MFVSADLCATNIAIKVICVAHDEGFQHVYTLTTVHAFAHCVIFPGFIIAKYVLLLLKSVARNLHICTRPGYNALLSDIMPFKLLNPKRTNTEEDQPRQHGTTTEHYPSRPTQKKSKVTTSGKLHICIFKVTDCAADMWRKFEGTTCQLWQVQFDYVGKTKLLYNFANSFAEFLSDVGAKQNPKASDMDDILLHYNAKLIETNQSDSDGAGFVPSRT